MFGLEETWKIMMFQILKLGHDHKKDDAEIRESLGMHFEIRNPMMDKGFAFSNPAAKFISWMRGGAFDIEGYPIKGDALANYVESIFDEDKIQIWSGDTEKFVYTYPERLQALRTCDEHGNGKTMNQVDVIIDRLTENVGSNRAIAVLYQAGMDSQRVDIPCLQLVQALVRNDNLYLSVFFRSNDIYGAWPSNMYFITHLGLLIQERLEKENPNVTFAGIDYHVSSAHIYKTDVDAAEKVIESMKSGLDDAMNMVLNKG